MNEQQYRTVIGWFNARPAAKKALRAVSTGSAVAVYLLYLGLLAWLAWHAMWVPLGVTAVVPAAAFVVGTALRAAINRPRPYTKYGFVPLFPKDKTGQSMPSRHCFSAAAIAAAVWYVLPPLGTVLAVLARHPSGLPRCHGRTLCQRRAGRAGLWAGVCRGRRVAYIAAAFGAGILRHHGNLNGDLICTHKIKKEPPRGSFQKQLING